MRLETQAVVRTEDGTEVGRIDRLVLDPETKEVTHLVLKKGVLPEDKVVPMGRVDAGTEEGVILRGDEAELELLPPFEEKHYVEGGGPAASPVAPMDLAVGPEYGEAVVPLPPAAAGTRPLVEVTRNIPDGTVAVKAGASVVAADSRKVGRLEQLRTRPGTDEVSELVIAQGFLGRTRRRIPVRWVQRMTDSVVRLQVGSALVDASKRVAR
jgi:sporulation protein YlmC with PRC-barrel domain